MLGWVKLPPQDGSPHQLHLTSACAAGPSWLPKITKNHGVGAKYSGFDRNVWWTTSQMAGRETWPWFCSSDLLRKLETLYIYIHCIYYILDIIYIYEIIYIISYIYATQGFWFLTSKHNWRDADVQHSEHDITFLPISCALEYSGAARVEDMLWLLLFGLFKQVLE
jgi:hypothetical protein